MISNRFRWASAFDIRHIARRDFERATNLFAELQGLSFGDATTVASMERVDIEFLYSFDTNFDAVDGITRLETADDQFP